MAETLTKAAKSQDAERAQEKKRQLEPASLPMKALADESVPFAGLLGVSAMELPLESHAAFLGDPRFSHSANNNQKAGLVTELQQTYGNQYVQRLLESMKVQTKLTVNSPDDQYEKEADRVADAVTRAPASSVQGQVPEEEEEIQAKPIAEQITPLVQKQEEEPIQTKLTSDIQVQRQEEEPEEEEEEPIQTKLTSDIQVQRQEEEPEEEEEEEEPIQTKLTSDIQVQRQAKEGLTLGELPQAFGSGNVTYKYAGVKALKNANAMWKGTADIRPVPTKLPQARKKKDGLWYSVLNRFNMKVKYWLNSKTKWNRIRDFPGGKYDPAFNTRWGSRVHEVAEIKAVRALWRTMQKNIKANIKAGFKTKAQANANFLSVFNKEWKVYRPKQLAISNHTNPAGPNAEWNFYKKAFDKYKASIKKRRRRKGHSR